MRMPLSVPPRQRYQTFMDFSLCTDIERLEADVAILGIPYSDPYSMDEVTNDQTNAPTAVRAMSYKVSMGLDRWDFDIGGSLFDDREVRVVDCGDVPGDPNDMKDHYRRAEQAARSIFETGALLITLGGRSRYPNPGVSRARQSGAHYPGAHRCAPRLAG